MIEIRRVVTFGRLMLTQEKGRSAFFWEGGYLLLSCKSSLVGGGKKAQHQYINTKNQVEDKWQTHLFSKVDTLIYPSPRNQTVS